MNTNEYMNFFQALANIVTTVGLPFAIATFIFQKTKDHKTEEDNAFHQLDESYVSFMKLCLANPDLDVFGKAIEKDYEPTEEQIRREDAIFSILISLFERAHVMFRNKSEDFRQSQWLGWIEYMKSYCCRPNFLRQWKNIGNQFDLQFYTFMEKLIEEETLAGDTLQITPEPITRENDTAEL
ncbi:MAG: hypothetical protein OEZ39_16910 [Gammaproteobacteria bacterium]|nr:hypothetical protein [Gammaproteobacteria bacterium]MDH5653542.1 hypothetical protein [Gammaproteobacteria bacterium]